MKNRRVEVRIAKVGLGGCGFALLVFDLNRIEGGRINYISNADRADMMTALRAFVADRDPQGRVSPVGARP